MLAIDALAIVILVPALFVLAATGSRILFAGLFEFGPTQCACGSLEADLETIDWLGTGQGIRFRPPVILDPVHHEDGFEVQASSLETIDSVEEREALVDRLADQPGTEVVEDLLGVEPRWASFRHGPVVISVSTYGRLT